MKTNINTIKDYINGLNCYGYFDDIDFSKFGKLELMLKIAAFKSWHTMLEKL